jgi:hypothetical protein
MQRTRRSCEGSIYRRNAIAVCAGTSSLSGHHCGRTGKAAPFSYLPPSIKMVSISDRGLFGRRRNMESHDYPTLPPGLREKAPEHLALHKRRFQKGELPEERLIALRDAIELCAWYRVPPPKWVADAVTELCYKQILADRRRGRLGTYRARFRQYHIHLIRWATVRHLRHNCRERARTWNDAYAEASRELRGTIAQGSEISMAASYKRHARNGFLKLIKNSGGDEALSETARNYFEARDAMLDIEKLFAK